MVPSDSAEPHGPQHTNTSCENHTSPMQLLLQKGSHQEHPQTVEKRHGPCFHLHQTLMSTPWPLRLVLLAVAAVLLVALGTAAAQAQHLDQAQVLGQEAYSEHQMRLPAETDAQLRPDPGAQAHATLAEDGLPRVPRSPVSPPTVTSLQPHRRGISKAMHDSSLSVGRQSEGPSHPSLMRKAPPRRLETTLLPTGEDGDHMLAEAASLRGGPQQSNFHGGYPPQYETGSESYYLSQNDYEESGDDLQEQQDHENIQRMNLKIARDAEDERRSRPRRVDNSFPGHGEERKLARHGRYDELLGSTHEASHVPQRYDTFGHAISEELWVGHRRAGNAVHPAARGASSRSRAPLNPDDNRILSRPSSHGYRWPRKHHASAAQNTQTGSGNTVEEETPKGSGRRVVHPGSKMTNRGSVTRSEAPFNRETVVIQESGDRMVSHHSMFTLRGGSAPRESIVAKNISLNDVRGLEEQNREMEAVNSLPVELIDPVYAVGVHPISEEVETFQETYSDVTADEGPQLPYQPSNYSYDDYFSEEDDNISKSSDQAHIHSFTVEVIPSGGTLDGNDAHPHYNPLDQLPKKHNSDQYGAANERLTSSVGTGVQNINLVDEQTSWGLHQSGPLTYTVIAASAVMGSLAVFTMFVLVAYSIVKCTKKPILNNYQVSDKKPVDITA